MSRLPFRGRIFRFRAIISEVKPRHSVGQSKHLNVQEFPMKPHRMFAVFAFFSIVWLAAAPAWAVNKEMVQLQTQVQQLQEQMTAMQRSFDERMGVMRNLVEQD